MSKRKLLTEKDFDRIKKYEGKKKPGTKRIMTTGEVAEAVGWSREMVRAVFKRATWPAYRRAHFDRIKANRAKRAEAKQVKMREEIRKNRKPVKSVADVPMPSEADLLPGDELTPHFVDKQYPLKPGRGPKDPTNYWNVAIGVTAIIVLVLVWWVVS
jgi:hypothetical protein